MRNVDWSPRFIRSLRRTLKRNPKLRDSIENTLELLQLNPSAPALATHKLKGDMDGTWTCKAGYDLRIVFEFVKNEKGEEDDILLLNIGTHKQVY